MRTRDQLAAVRLQAGIHVPGQRPGGTGPAAGPAAVHPSGHAMERGKLRHIRSVHYTERVIQRSTCDNALVPMLSRNLIYDNGACLEGKGVDRCMDRMTAHLQQFYRANGFSNEGLVVVFDFTGYFDNILHSECFNVYSKEFRDQKILWLLGSFIVPFGYPRAESNWQRVKNPDKSQYTGKSLGLGSQVSQITAVSYPNRLDHFIKQILHVRRYSRYMDDGYMLFRFKKAAKEAIERVIAFCKKLGITVNPRKTRIEKIKRGFRFLKVWQVVKKLTWDKVPTNLLAFIVAMAVTLLAFFAVCRILAVHIVWYMVAAAIGLGFFVAFAAMFGWDKFRQMLEQTRRSADRKSRPPPRSRRRRPVRKPGPLPGFLQDSQRCAAGCPGGCRSPYSWCRETPPRQGPPEIRLPPPGPGPCRPRQSACPCTTPRRR